MIERSAAISLAISEHLKKEEGTCGTASLLGLLHPVRPREEYVRMIKKRPLMKNVVLGVALGLLDQEEFCFIESMEEKINEVPSSFFKRLAIESKNVGARFIGGLIRSNYHFVCSGQTQGHVVAVREVNPDMNTASMINSAPLDGSADFFRILALPTIDELVTKLDVGKVVRAIGFTSVPLSHDLISGAEMKTYVDYEIEQWKAAYKNQI